MMHHVAWFLVVIATWAMVTESAWAQEPFAQQFGVQDGLPSLEVYQVKRDGEGYMWVATDRGVCRFDGSKFETYTQKDGLEDLTIVAMDLDNRGRMWFAGLSGGLYYFEYDRFHAFAANDLLKPMLAQNIVLNFEVIEDTVWLGVLGSDPVRVQADGTWFGFQPRDTSSTRLVYHENIHRQSVMSIDFHKYKDRQFYRINQGDTQVFELHESSRIHDLRFWSDYTEQPGCIGQF